MNLYTQDLALFDFANFSDPIVDSISISNLHSSNSSPSSSTTVKGNDGDKSFSDDDKINGKEVIVPKPESPPRHRHDGTSPLPLGMDWSLPPRKWDGRDSIWPHDPCSGWSYCVTIPSWILLPKARGSDHVAFYRVQVGIQSPEGFTTTRGIVRRFSDFLKLLSELKKAFPQKTLPPAPPRRILRVNSNKMLEERRCSLEDWMEKLLSDIDVSRSAPVGTFLELEAAVRFYFDDVNQQTSDANASVSNMVPSTLLQTNSDVSLLADSSLVGSDHNIDSPDEVSELGTPRHGRDGIVDLGMETTTSEQNIIDPTETTVKYGIFKEIHSLGNQERFSRRRMHNERQKSTKVRHKLTDGMEFLPELEYQRLDGHVRRLSNESIASDLSSVRASELSNSGAGNLFGDNSLDLSEVVENPKIIDSPLTSDVQFAKDLLLTFPSYERQKLNRVLNTVRQRLAVAKTDMEDLIARLNQEVAVRQFLATKVKDLEVDLETTKNNCKESMEQAVLTEKENFTQMQWDVEEHRRKCLELEIKLKSEQDEKARVEHAKTSIIAENAVLVQQLQIAREELEDLHKRYEESELKSKADVKLLVKEVKSLRTSQTELKQELGRLMKEKLEIERVLQMEKQRMELVTTANTKLLHECEILHNRLEECSVNFLIEDENKLIVDNSSPSDAPSDAIDLLITSDNRIGLLLAEAQLLAQDVENSVAKLEETQNIKGDDGTDNKLRKMLTEILIDNANLRMQINSVIRCTLNQDVKSDEDIEEDETPLRKTVLSKFLEK